MDADRAEEQDDEQGLHVDNILMEMREKKQNESMAPESDPGLTLAFMDKAPVPDGGWGWVVVLAAFIGTTIWGAALASFAILYIEWVQYFGAQSGKVGWIGSLDLFMGTGNMLSTYIAILTATIAFGCSLHAILISVFLSDKSVV